jgi:hypothetical protein
MLEDLLAIELMLAHDLLSVAPTQHVLGRWHRCGATHDPRRNDSGGSAAGCGSPGTAGALSGGFQRVTPGRQAGGWVRSQRPKCGTVNAKVPRSAE